MGIPTAIAKLMMRDPKMRMQLMQSLKGGKMAAASAEKAGSIGGMASNAMNQAGNYGRMAGDEIMAMLGKAGDAASDMGRTASVMGRRRGKQALDATMGAIKNNPRTSIGIGAGLGGAGIGALGNELSDEDIAEMLGM